jgi:flagellar motor switch protein FliM
VSDGNPEEAAEAEAPEPAASADDTGQAGGNPAREGGEPEQAASTAEDTPEPGEASSGQAAGPEGGAQATSDPDGRAASADGPEDSAPAVEAASAEAPAEPARERAEAGTVLPPSDRRRGDRRQRERRVHALDFSQPTKFNAELRRRIVRALGPFCESFAIRLSTELRTSVDLTIADAHQLTWSAAKAQLPADSIAAELTVSPIERKMLLNIELPIVLRALECLLGGSASQAAPERRLSEVDWALTRPLLEGMTAQLASAWRDLGGLGLSLGEIDTEGDAGVSAPLGEPTFAVPIDVQIDGLTSTMMLFVPWSAIAPVADEILGGGSQLEDADPTDGLAVHRGLAVAHVLLRAEVGSTRIPVEEMLALAPGSLLELEDRADSGVQVFAERVPLGRAHPGLRGSRRAIKLITPLEPGRVSAIPSAPSLQLGRSALIGAGEALDSDEEYEPRHSVELALPLGAGAARMLRVPVRVWAELGRTRLPLGSALDLPLGTVLELEQSAESPLELFANGKSFALASLQVSGEGRWAVQIETLA